MVSVILFCSRFILTDFLSPERRVISTACVYFHRFYLFHSYETHARFVSPLLERIFVSDIFTEHSCCLSVPGFQSWGNANQTERYCVLLFQSAQATTNGKRSGIGIQTLNYCVFQDAKEMQRTVLLSERILLQTLNFDLNVIHPNAACVAKIRELRSE